MNNNNESLDARAIAKAQSAQGGSEKKNQPSKEEKSFNFRYTQLWSSNNPGLIIFLLDQSASMAELYRTTGKSKAQYAADIVSDQINEFIIKNKPSETFRNRVCFVVIGYGGNDPVTGVQTLLVGNVEDLALSTQFPIREKEIKKGDKIIKIAGSKQFVTPRAEGITPMKEAFEVAKGIIDNFIEKYPNAPAPLIINISDGFPEVNGKNQKDYQQEVVEIVKEIRKKETPDGKTLVFNIHIGEGTPVGFEGDENKIKSLNDACVQFLFDISSFLPKRYRKNAIGVGLDEDFPNLVVDEPKPRGFISNADSKQFHKFIIFGTK